MKGFVETIILVIIFFVLITFSFLWFNEEKRSLKDIPYVSKVFSSISAFSENLKEVSTKKENLKNIFKRTKEGAQGLVPEKTEEPGL